MVRVQPRELRGATPRFLSRARRGAAIVTDVTSADERLDYHLRDVVRLLNRHGDIPAGTVGSVIGCFVKDNTYVVNFTEEGARVAEVHPDEIVLTELS